VLAEVLRQINLHADDWTSNDVRTDFETESWEALLHGASVRREEQQVPLADWLKSPLEMDGTMRMTFLYLEQSTDAVCIWRGFKREAQGYANSAALWSARNRGKGWFRSVDEYQGLQPTDNSRTDNWPQHEYQEYHDAVDSQLAREELVTQYESVARKAVTAFWANLQVLSTGWNTWADKLLAEDDRSNTELCTSAKELLDDIAGTSLAPDGVAEWRPFLNGFFLNFRHHRERKGETTAA